MYIVLYSANVYYIIVFYDIRPPCSGDSIFLTVSQYQHYSVLFFSILIHYLLFITFFMLFISTERKQDFRVFFSVFVLYFYTASNQALSSLLKIITIV